MNGDVRKQAEGSLDQTTLDRILRYLELVFQYELSAAKTDMGGAQWIDGVPRLPSTAHHRRDSWRSRRHLGLPTPVLQAATAVVIAGVLLAGFVAPAILIPGASNTTMPSPQSGVVGSVVVAGGPIPGASDGNQAAELIVSNATGTVTTRIVDSGTPVRLDLPPGQYQLSGVYGNAGCTGVTVQVVAGQFTPFAVTCSIR